MNVRRESMLTPRQRSIVDLGDVERWYRYGDSNPGPVAENHVS